MLPLVRARYPSTGRTEIAPPRGCALRGLGASPLASRLATSHRPNRVPHRTDGPFTSCCSPPRVSTTQWQSVTSYVDLEWTFTPPTRCALRRTSAVLSGGMCRAEVPALRKARRPALRSAINLRGRGRHRHRGKKSLSSIAERTAYSRAGIPAGGCGKGHVWPAVSPPDIGKV